MALFAIIGTTIDVTVTAYKIVAAVRASEGLNEESKKKMKLFETDLEMAQDMLNQLNYTARRVSANEEILLIAVTNSLQSAIADTEKAFDDVKDGLTFLERLLRRNEEALQRITQMNERLNNARARTDQTILSNHLRTWKGAKPKSLAHADHDASISTPDSATSTESSSDSRTAASAAVTTNNIHTSLDLSEFVMAHDYICGIASTHEFIYIATKYEITIISLDEKREIKARYGAEGNGPCRFKHISYLYIPSNDETNLYIVDCGQQCVHQYQIDNTGHRFDYVHQYFVIANVREPYDLVSCVIFNENLYVSDNANHCLHIFPLKADRQSDYLVDKSIIRFSPGSLCVHEKYLFVADCSVQSPGILVFNEQCQTINWFRHSMLKEILAMDIDPKVNDLYILTSTKHENDEKRKGLLIVPIDLVVRL
ncbi:unnamed protein product [Rotaria sp. Silwood1]|nr:unnamed protein product [Rotaria sp. Silwood1]